MPYLDNIADGTIVGVSNPNGIPLVYGLDDNLQPIGNYHLGDAGAAVVAAQGKASRHAI